MTDDYVNLKKAEKAETPTLASDQADHPQTPAPTTVAVVPA